MNKLNLIPEKISYQISFKEDSKSTSLNGGYSIFSKYILNSSKIIDIQFILTEFEYDYFRSFYRTISHNACSPFTMDLILDSSSLIEYTCYFIPGSVKLTKIEGKLFYVSAQIEVLSNEVN